MSDPT